MDTSDDIRAERYRGPPTDRGSLAVDVAMSDGTEAFDHGDDSTSLLEEVHSLGVDWSGVDVDLAARSLARLNPGDPLGPGRVRAAILDYARHIAAGTSPVRSNAERERSRRILEHPLGRVARQQAAATLPPTERTPVRIDLEADLLLRDTAWRHEHYDSQTPGQAAS